MFEATLTVKSSKSPLDGRAVHRICPVGGIRMGRAGMFNSPCVVLVLDLSLRYDPPKIMDEL